MKTNLAKFSKIVLQTNGEFKLKGVYTIETPHLAAEGGLKDRGSQTRLLYPLFYRIVNNPSPLDIQGVWRTNPKEWGNKHQAFAPQMFRIKVD